MTKAVEIAGREIGPGRPCFIVAEMSANHGGTLEHACNVVRAAAANGADAIKLQTFTADTMTLRSNEAPFRVGKSLWEGRTLHELYHEAHMPWDWQPRLKALADELGIVLFSTPFDRSSVEFLADMQVPAYKIASFELVDLPLITEVARKRKPIVMSTGMASPEEVQEAVAAARSVGNDQIVLLKCTSAYPAPFEEVNLRTIPHLAETLKVPIGLSDHTMGTAVPVASVALGACMIEKHFCLSRSEGGPDSAFSMEPRELKQLVEDVRKVEAALGRVDYHLGEEEARSRAYRRSLFVVEDVRAGERLTEANIRAIRPGQGLPPKHFAEVLGRRARTAIKRGTPLAWDLLES
jgi:pseudaminic acid synthase